MLFQEIYDEGTVLIREGEPGDTFFVISEGTVSSKVLFHYMFKGLFIYKPRAGPLSDLFSFTVNIS